MANISLTNINAFKLECFGKKHFVRNNEHYVGNYEHFGRNSNFF